MFDCTFGIITAAGELNTIHAVVGTITVLEATPVDALGPTILQIAPDPNDRARLVTQWLVSSSAAVGDGIEVNLSLFTSGNNLQPVAIADGDYKVLYPERVTQTQKTAVEPPSPLLWRMRSPQQMPTSAGRLSSMRFTQQSPLWLVTTRASRR